MDERRGRRFGLYAFGLGLIAGAAWFACTGGYVTDKDEADWKLRDAPDLRSLSRSNRASDRQRAKRLKEDYDAVFAAVLSRNPGLEPKWKTVPDEKNGFLQWLVFTEKRKGGDWGLSSLELPKKVRRILNGEDEWSRTIMQDYFEEHSHLLEEITDIGLLPEQSVCGISPDRWSFIEANIAKVSAELLCADARLAAESGDQARALRRMRAAVGLARHHGEVETPTLLAATVAILIKLTVLEETMNHVLPAMDLEKGEYGRWRGVVMPERVTPFPTLLRGEFWGGVRGLVIPVVSNNAGSSEKEIPDPDALYDAIAQGYLHAMKRADGLSYQDMWKSKSEVSWFPEAPGKLSEQSRDLYGTLQTGWIVYTGGLVRTAAIYRRYDAAFAILEGREVPVELLTGKPFVFNPETSILSFPDDAALDEIKLDELKLQ